MSKFNYKKAEADLYDVGAHYPDEIYDYKSEKSFRSFMKENGLMITQWIALRKDTDIIKMKAETLSLRNL